MLLFACGGAPLVHGVFEAEPLRGRVPGLSEAAAARLSESTPFPRPTQNGVDWLLCRWRSAWPIPVSLPADASAGERSVLQHALDAWEAAGLGVRFVVQPAGAPASITISFAEAGRFDEPGLSGATRADCKIGDRAAARNEFDARSRARDVFEAELVFARIALARRTPLDWRDRDRALAPAELAGAALHEIGHALGFSGHASGGGSVMVRTREDVSRIGARVLAGGALDEPALRALYALPTGVVVARVPLTSARSAPFVALAELARARGWSGPFVRVGDLGARVFHVDADGREVGIEIDAPGRFVRDGGRFVGLPDAAARRVLETEEH